MRHAVDSIDRVLIPVEMAVKSWVNFVLLMAIKFVEAAMSWTSQGICARRSTNKGTPDFKPRC